MTGTISLTKILWAISAATALSFAIHYLESGVAPEPIPIEERQTKEDYLAKLMKTSHYEKGQLTSRRSGFLKGCRLYSVLEKPRKKCREDSAFYKRVIDVDVRALDLSQVQVRNYQDEAEPTPSVSLRIGFNDDSERKHRDYSKKSGEIAKRENDRYPYDVGKRLRSLKKRYETELSGDAFKIASETYYYCSGLEIKAPPTQRRVVLAITGDDPSTFLELVERYRVSFCDD